jgi:hypothetical protein
VAIRRHGVACIRIPSSELQLSVKRPCHGTDRCGDRTDFFAELAEMLNLDDYGDVRTERRVICELAKIGAVWALEARDKVD